MNIQFMHKNHRGQLEENPCSAIIIWTRLIHLARHQASEFQWHLAIKSYGNALETAEIILSDVPAPDAVNRYVRTAMELIYTLRQCNDDYDAKGIVTVIKKKVGNILYPAKVDLLIKPLTDVASAPLSDVDGWMKKLFITDQVRTQQVH